MSTLSKCMMIVLYGDISVIFVFLSYDLYFFGRPSLGSARRIRLSVDLVMNCKMSEVCKIVNFYRIVILKFSTTYGVLED